MIKSNKEHQGRDGCRWVAAMQAWRLVDGFCCFILHSHWARRLTVWRDLWSWSWSWWYYSILGTWCSTLLGICIIFDIQLIVIMCWYLQVGAPTFTSICMSCILLYLQHFGQTLVSWSCKLNVLLFVENKLSCVLFPSLALHLLAQHTHNEACNILDTSFMFLANSSTLEGISFLFGMCGPFDPIHIVQAGLKKK